MAVKIYGSNHLGGMPILDYKIAINGVVISLTKEDFIELEKEVTKKSKSDYKKAIEVFNKWDKGVDTLRSARKDLINLFYEGDTEDIDALFFEKELSEINKEELDQFLNKYKSFLGFE